MNKYLKWFLIYIGVALVLGTIVALIVINKNKDYSKKETEAEQKNDTTSIINQLQTNIELINNLAFQDEDAFAATTNLYLMQTRIIVAEEMGIKTPIIDSLIKVNRQLLHSEISSQYKTARLKFPTYFNLPNTKISVSGDNYEILTITSPDFNLSGNDKVYIKSLEDKDIHTKFRFKKIILTTGSSFRTTEYDWDTAPDTLITDVQ